MLKFLKFWHIFRCQKFQRNQRKFTCQKLRKFLSSNFSLQLPQWIWSDEFWNIVSRTRTYGWVIPDDSFNPVIPSKPFVGIMSFFCSKIFFKGANKKFYRRSVTKMSFQNIKIYISPEWNKYLSFHNLSRACILLAWKVL